MLMPDNWKPSIAAAAKAKSYEHYLELMAEAELQHYAELIENDDYMLDAAEHADQAANNDWCE